MVFVKPFLGIFSCALFFSACSMIMPAGPRDYIRVKNIFQVPDSDPFEVAELKVENDSLYFLASYGGGCRDHVFTLYAAQSEFENTGHLYIQHNGNHDLCRAVIWNDTVSFSLAGLRRDLKLGSEATLRLAMSDSVYTLKY